MCWPPFLMCKGNSRCNFVLIIRSYEMINNFRNALSKDVNCYLQFLKLNKVGFGAHKAAFLCLIWSDDII